MHYFKIVRHKLSSKFFFFFLVIFSKCFVKGVKNHKSATNHKGMSHGNAAASIEVAFQCHHLVPFLSAPWDHLPFRVIKNTRKVFFTLDYFPYFEELSLLAMFTFFSFYSNYMFLKTRLNTKWFLLKNPIVQKQTSLISLYIS